jgi:hypothetical protein
MSRALSLTLALSWHVIRITLHFLSLLPIRRCDSLAASLNHTHYGKSFGYDVTFGRPATSGKLDSFLFR